MEDWEPLVKGQVFAHENTQKARDEARDGQAGLSGFEPYSPSKPPDEFKAKNGKNLMRPPTSREGDMAKNTVRVLSRSHTALTLSEPNPNPEKPGDAPPLKTVTLAGNGAVSEVDAETYQAWKKGNRTTRSSARASSKRSAPTTSPRPRCSAMSRPLRLR